MDDEQCYFRRNICFYKRKSKLDKHSYQEKMYSRIFKIIRIQSDPRSVVRIEIIFNIDAFGKLNVYADKDKINYKRRKKENNLYSRWLSLIYQSYGVHSRNLYFMSKTKLCTLICGNSGL